MRRYDYSEFDDNLTDDPTIRAIADELILPRPDNTSPLPDSVPTVASPAVPAALVSRRVPQSSGAASGPNTWLTVSQVAIELGISPQRVRQLLDAGSLKGKKVNPRLWIVQRKDVKYVGVRLPGRPRK